MTSREKSVRGGRCAESVARGARTGLLEGDLEIRRRLGVGDRWYTPVVVFVRIWPSVQRRGGIVPVTIRPCSPTVEQRYTVLTSRVFRGLDPSQTQLGVDEGRTEKKVRWVKEVEEKAGVTHGHDRAGVGTG
jgi:hypothetical protein